ncbi:Uncharacterised protein g1423 [Pycnogonum litorale]
MVSTNLKLVLLCVILFCLVDTNSTHWAFNRRPRLRILPRITPQQILPRITQIFNCLRTCLPTLLGCIAPCAGNATCVQPCVTQYGTCCPVNIVG